MRLSEYKRELVLILSSMSILGESRPSPCFLNVSKCHTHETFLYMTLHGNTEKRLKLPKKHESLYYFCINPFVLTFVMKHMTSHQFPQKSYHSAYPECPLTCDQIVVLSCSVASATVSSSTVYCCLKLCHVVSKSILLGTQNAFRRSLLSSQSP